MAPLRPGEALPSRKAAISFTGGKDSMTVLHLLRAPGVALAAAAGWTKDPWRADIRQRLDQLAGCEVALLVTFVPAGSNQPFKAHPLDIVKLQARALGLPHIVMQVSASPTFLDSYRDNIRALREEHGVQVLATGDILDVCSSFMPRAAAGTGVQLLSPLWHIDRRLLLELIWAYGMTPVITCVNMTKFGGAVSGGGLAGGTQSAVPAQALAPQAQQKEQQQVAAEGLREIAEEGRKTDGACGASATHGSDTTVTMVSTATTTTVATGAGLAPTSGANPDDCGVGDDSEGGSGVCFDTGLDCGRGLLGRDLSRELHARALLPAAKLYNVDECGEWGEYHTMVTHSRLFSAPIKLISNEVRQEGDYAFLALLQAELGHAVSSDDGLKS